MSQPGLPQHPILPGSQLWINQVNVDMVQVEDRRTGFSIIVPRDQAPADGILDSHQTFVLEAVPGDSDLWVVRWWYGLEEWVTRDRIPRVAIAQPPPELNRAGGETLYNPEHATHPLVSASRLHVSRPLFQGGNGANLCTDDRWLVACDCGRRELCHPHSPMVLAGSCRNCLAQRAGSVSEPLQYPHTCFSLN